MLVIGLGSVILSTNFNGDVSDLQGSQLPRLNRFTPMTLSIRVPRDLYEGSSDFSEVTQFEVNRSSSELGGTSDDIDVSELLPDMKVYDYFETIKNMFNLIIVPDEKE